MSIPILCPKAREAGARQWLQVGALVYGCRQRATHESAIVHAYEFQRPEALKTRLEIGRRILYSWAFLDQGVCSPTHSFVAFGTLRDQILLHVATRVAPEFEVVHLQRLHVHRTSDTASGCVPAPVRAVRGQHRA